MVWVTSIQHLNKGCGQVGAPLYMVYIEDYDKCVGRARAPQNQSAKFPEWVLVVSCGRVILRLKIYWTIIRSVGRGAPL